MALITKSARSDIGAGLASALLSLTYALSYGALLFSPPNLLPYVGYTISSALITTIVTVWMVAVTSKIKFSVAGPESSTVAVLASLVIVVASSTPDGLEGYDLAIFTLMTMCLVSLVTGIVMIFLGHFKLGTLIRFVPISVAGGFLAAAGSLMMKGALYLATGLTITDLFGLGLSDLQLIKLGAVVSFAFAFFLATHYSSSQMALPIAIFVAILIIHGALTSNDISITQAQEMGLLLNAGADAAVFIPPVHGDISLDLLRVLVDYAPEIIVIIIVTALSILLIIAGVELDQNIDSDLNHELKIHGYAIGVTSFLGGFVGIVSLSRTLLNATMSSRFPVAALITVILCAAVFVFGTSIISVLPQAALAGMVLFLGAQIAYRWFIASYKTLDRNEYLLVVVIASTTLYAGFISGLVLGIVAGCILFAARASFVSVVRQELSGEAYRSRVVRSADEETQLKDLNKTIRIYELQGFLFFGTAYNFYNKIKAELESRDAPVRYLILSFKHVTGVDASAEQVLQKIFLAADKHNCAISTIEMPRQEQISVARLLRRSPAMIDDQNYAAIYDAMEAIEENFLRDLAVEGNGASLLSWLQSRISDQKSAEALFSALQEKTYGDADIICRQGEAADAIFFLDTGRIDVVSNDVPGQPFRIYSFMRHTMLGEMGFMRHETRSADLVARGETVVYSLDRAAFDAMTGKDDATISALLELISVTLSDRMVSANRTIAELQA